MTNSYLPVIDDGDCVRLFAGIGIYCRYFEVNNSRSQIASIWCDIGEILHWISQ